MALNKWLFDTVAAPYIDKAAEKAHAKFESDRELLRKDIGKIEKLLDRDRTSLKELLDRDRASFNEKFEHIDKQLSNHITETNDKIKELQADVKGLKSGQAALEVKNAERHAELAEGQAKLEVKIEKGQAALEVKNAERHAELYKLLSSKSPDKKQ